MKNWPTNMFNKFKTNLGKALGIKVNFKTEFGCYNAALAKAYKEFPPNVTTRIEINALRAENVKQGKLHNEMYNEESKQLNLKYKKLDQDVLLASMKREIEILKHADASQFNVPIKK